jgi:hypothetical protein
MEGLWIIVAFFCFVAIANRVGRLYFTAKHPRIMAAWDDLEEKKRERQKKLAGGAFNAGLGIAKMFLKK